MTAPGASGEIGLKLQPKGEEVCKMIACAGFCGKNCPPADAVRQFRQVRLG